jgi:hypothetical protein
MNDSLVQLFSSVLPRAAGSLGINKIVSSPGLEDGTQQHKNIPMDTLSAEDVLVLDILGSTQTRYFDQHSRALHGAPMSHMRNTRTSCWLNHVGEKQMKKRPN